MLETPTIRSHSNCSSVYALANFTPVVRNSLGTETYYNEVPTGHTTQKKGPVNMSVRRFVTVIVMDPNENVPLDECILYKGDEKFTDATDQELFFELDIKDILDKHNTKRVKFLNKKVTARDEYLEPAKIRDLKMVVVNGATF